jgi:putative ABC transport system permease protein
MRAALIRQFLTESLLFSFIAIVIAVVATSILLPSFNNIANRSISLPWNELWFTPTLFAVSLVVGIVSGIYPAFHLSSFQPGKVLKIKNKTGLRSFLVVFQFTISTALIMGTAIVYRQTNYILNKKLGFDKENVLILNDTHTLGRQAKELKNSLESLADVESVSVTGFIPVEGFRRNGGSHLLEGHSQDETISGQYWHVDHDYLETMGLTLAEGRDFSDKIASDSQATIINKEMTRQLHIPDPIGQRITNVYGTFTVIGVVEDFHFETLRENIRPVSLMLGKDINSIIIRLRPGDPQSAVASITEQWKKFSPHQPVRMSFLDDQYARTYDDVKRFRSVIVIFTSLAIIVACLGLFALSAFMIEQRGKEISIRMVLGAPVANILRLLSQNFVVLVSISFVLATPVAWYLMDQWLQDYAYKIEITWDVFAVTGLSALAIALLTIGYQSIKASLTNPVANLKSE